MKTLKSKITKQNRRRMRRRIVSILTAVVVFLTTYALVIPAITMDTETAAQEPGIEIAQPAPEAVVSEPAPVQAEPIAAEPVAAEPIAAEPVVQPAADPAAAGADNAAMTAVDASAGGSDASGDSAVVEIADGTTPLAAPDVAASSGQEGENTTSEEENQDKNTETETDEKDNENEENEEEKKLAVSPLVYDNAEYTVKVSFGESAQIPDGTTLSWREFVAGSTEYSASRMILNNKMKENGIAEEDLEEAISSNRFFEMLFIDKNGAQFLPMDTVDVLVEYKDAANANVNNQVPAEGGSLYAVTFRTDDGQPTIANLITTNAKDGSAGLEAAGGFIRCLRVQDFPANDYHTNAVIGQLAVKAAAADTDNAAEGAETDADAETGSGEASGIVTTKDDEEENDEDTADSLTTQYLTADGEAYNITLTYGPDAGIPDDATLAVTEILQATDTYDEYVSKTEDALDTNEKVTFARFFDITIVHDGVEIQPTDTVNVKIELADDLSDEVKVVHFEHSDAAAAPENIADPVVIDSERVEAETLENAVGFEAKSFSVFGVVETETIETTLLTADGKTLKVTVTYGADAQIPEGASLEVKEITENDDSWGERSARLAHTLSENYGNYFISDARFLNISIMVNGEEYEPKAPVEIKVEYTDPMQTEYTVDTVDTDPDGSGEFAGLEEEPQMTTRFAVVHYEEGNPQLLDAEIEKAEDLITESVTVTPGFSEYDFVNFDEYEAREAEYGSMPGTIGTLKPNDIVLAAANDTQILRNTGDVPDHAKLLQNNNDGTYTISLNVEGDADTTSEASDVNVLIVYDVSSSMTIYHAPSETGRYGAPSSAYSTNYPELYRRNDNNYTALNNDTYAGTVYTRSGGRYNVYTGKRYSALWRADVAEKTVYDFVHALFGYQNAAKDNINAAVVTFDASAHTLPRNALPVRWTQTESDITQYFRSTGTSHNSALYGSGTNWEAALGAANTAVNAVTNDNPTYVVFITDGAPTNRNNSSNRDVERCYEAARDEARSVYNATTGSGGEFFGIYAYGEEADWLASLMYYAYNNAEPPSSIRGTTFDTDGYYNAASTAALTEAINAIFQRIVQTLGISAVSITDGTTSHVETTSGTISHLLEVNESSYQYWLTIPVVPGSGSTYTFTMPDKVTGNDVTYTVTPAGDNVTISWNGGSATYPGNVNLNTLTLGWTQSTNFYSFAPPAAHFNSSTGAVDWSLANVGTLLDGVTYTVTFECYPSQETLDYIADLKNGKIQYEDLDANIRKYLVKNGSEYELKTNTSASLTYTDTRVPNAQPTTTGYTNPDPVNTSAVEELAVSKKWENALDGQEAQLIQLNVTRDEVERYHVTLRGPTWEGSAFISIGIMTVHDGVVSIKAPGHDFSFEEPENLTYHWELDVPVVHPMKINGVDKILEEVTGDDIPSAMLDMTSPSVYQDSSGTYYKMTYNGAVKYYREESSEVKLTATNSRRSTLNVTKSVTGTNAPADAEFSFDMKVTNPNYASGSETNYDSDYWLWFSIYDTNASATVTDPDLASADGIRYQLSDESVVTAKPEAGFNGYYCVPSNGKTITVRMKAGYNLRFLNLPTGTGYEITESSTMPDECFEFVSVAGEREYYEYVLDDDGNYTYDDQNRPVTQKKTEPAGTVTGSKITGTIAKTNSNYNAAYTNKYDAANVTVQKVVEGYDDGSTFEIIGTVTKNGSAAASLPLQSDTKVSAVEGAPNKLKISLKNGETASVKLPAGVTLAINETANSNYTASYSYKLTDGGAEQTGNTITGVSDGNAMIVTNTSKSTSIHLKKVAKGTATVLPGSAFKLYRRNSAGVYEADENIDATKAARILSLADGTLTVSDLPSGDYKLTETKAPSGYIIMTKDIYFTVNASGSGYVIIPTDGQEPFDSADIGAGTEGTNKDTLVIPNTPGKELPMTGGSGTLPYTLGGLMLVIASALMYGFRMRRRERRLQ